MTLLTFTNTHDDWICLPLSSISHWRTDDEGRGLWVYTQHGDRFSPKDPAAVLVQLARGFDTVLAADGPPKPPKK